MSSLSNPNSTGLIISEDYIPVDAYQAIYHKLTKKTETISRQYKEHYTVTFEDLCNLNQRIEQGLRHLKVIKASNCEISHATKDDYSHTYSSFDKFRTANLDVRECTSSLVYEFNFLIVLESDVEAAKNIGQRYKIRMIFQQNLSDKDDFSVPYYVREMIRTGKIYLSIDYTDYSIAQTLEAIINSWRKSLPERKVGNSYKAVMKLEGELMEILPAAAAALPLGAAA